jgi:flagellar biosynthesis protein FliP
MKHQNNSNPVIRSSLALALAVVIWSPVQVRSAEPADGKMMMGGKMMSETNMMQRSQTMPEQRAKMMDEIKAQDDQLTGQISEMNSAPADKKVDLMAAVLTQMAAQRTTAYLRMENMRGEMMQLRQMGKEPMSPDSMMKGMN